MISASESIQPGVAVPVEETIFFGLGSQARPVVKAHGHHRSKHGWRLGWRVFAAVVVVLLVFKVYAGWHWSKRIGAGPGVTFSPTHAYVGWQSAMTLLVDTTNDWSGLMSGWALGWMGFVWHFGYLAATALPAGVLAVVAYECITRRFTPVVDADPDSRCRKCGHILNGLSQPRCPECGERI